ncbi:MAG: 6-phosphofructokinase [Leptospiraceae bacterium]|nr:6-phosphofructokinase [Leptospiraceae bacterium]MDW8306894.1 ATP-dependent 6-phosphofructokinase [Leptospiraceae bacterium]
MRVAILTSGGDAPGMNACIRAFVRRSLWEKNEVFGIFRGYQGLLNGEIKQLESRDVGLIINQGGTFLGTARCEEFFREEGQKKAAEILHQHKIDALCVIGGDGSFRGLLALSEFYKGQVIGIPGTIDNDIPGTEYTIGFDTAVGTAVAAIDKIRDTALSHGRIFFVEVMGRKSGQIALSTALSCGAEDVLIPEEKTNIDVFIQRLEEGRRKGKRFGIVVVAEGDEAGGAFKIAEIVMQRTGLPIRVSVLGHIQRGGNPSAYDRVWGSRMGDAAVKFIKNQMTRVFTAMKGGQIVPAYLAEAVSGVRTVDPEMVQLVRICAQ